MSHALPEPVKAQLDHLIQQVEEGLQAKAYKLTTVTELDEAFDRRAVLSPMLRALICDEAGSVVTKDLEVVALPNLGCEARIVHDEVERRFRFKSADRDRFGRLQVTTSSDSLLTSVAKELTLFDHADDLSSASEQWVLPYFVDPVTRTFSEAYAGRVVGVVGEGPPFKLLLDDITQLTISSPSPFFPGSKDDLEFPDDEKLPGEASS